MDVYGCLWMFMDVYGCLWMFMDVYGCLWMFMDVYGCLWMFMDVYGCLWMFMVGIYIYMALDMVYKPSYNWEGTTLCERIGLTLQLSLQC